MRVLFIDWGTGDRLVVDAALCGGEQLGAGLPELVPVGDGLLEGSGKAVELPDDYGVVGSPGPGHVDDESVELVAGADVVSVDSGYGQVLGGAVVAAGCLRSSLEMMLPAGVRGALT